LADRHVDVDHLDELDAEHWIARWERRAEKIGRPRQSRHDWIEGELWIRGDRTLERRRSHGLGPGRLVESSHSLLND
jgi:hypothetical protein